MGRRPNVIVIVMDDQGYGDLGCLGNRSVYTPHLDELCTRGMRLDNWYANAPVCSPTRASILTGLYPCRTGVTRVLPGHRGAEGLESGVESLPRVLRRAGYRTFACGKWHLGAAPECWPDRHGFEHWFGHLGGCIDYYSHILYWGMNKPGPGNNPVHDLWEDGQEVWRNGEYMTDLIVEKTQEYIRRGHAAEGPFFVYTAFNAPHYPLHPPSEWSGQFSYLAKEERAYAATLAAADAGVGEIVKTVRELGIEEETMIIFTSDNGPSREPRNWLDGSDRLYFGSSSGGLRGGKGSLFEGGIRVPGAVYWPGHVSPGVCLAPAATMDIASTVCSATGVSMGGTDGISLFRLFEEGASLSRDLLWGHAGQLAIRRGRHKLVVGGVDPGGTVACTGLFDLVNDPGERVDVSAREPDVRGELEREVGMWAERSRACGATGACTRGE